MQLVPMVLKEVLTKDVDITIPEVQDSYITDLIETATQDENAYPAELADRYIWIFNMFEKEQAYWQTKLELAKKYVDALEKLEEKAKAYVRRLMEENEVLYATDQKIVAQDYKDKDLSFIDESKLRSEEFTYDIKGLSYAEYENILSSLTISEDGEERLRDKIADNVKKNPFGISKLGKDHPAVHEEFKKLVKVKNLTQQELKGIRQ